jgi:cytochrome c oxidase assembly protein subunit 11
MTRNRTTQLILVGVAIGMLTLGFYSKTLYDTFCKVTGFGGTPKIAMNEDNLSVVLDRVVTVNFDSNVSTDLPWQFRPTQRSMDVQLGQTGLAYYTAKNTCFCFTDQTLQPGEEMDMPVLFFIDPEMDASERHSDVKDVVLSYTFFVADNQPEVAAENSVEALP